MNSPSSGWSERYRLLAGVLLLALSFLAYQPGLRGGFIWDDDIYLTGNPLIHAPDGLARFWFTGEAMDYYPLSSSTLWLEWRAWGDRVGGYRLVNLLLHGLAGILLWRILARGSPGLAWPAAALFVLHPLNAEAVAWIAQRKTVLAGLFALASLWAWLRFEERGRPLTYLGSLLLFLASLLSKTTAVTLPAVLLVLAWARQGRVTRRALLQTLPFFALSVALGLVTIWFQRHHAIALHEVRPESMASKVAGTGWAAWFYVAKFLWPHPLAICYPRWVIDPGTVRAWLPLLAGVLALGALARCPGSVRPWPLALGVIYLGLLAPVLGLLDIGFMIYALAADHWAYIGLPALCALAAVAVQPLARRFPRALAGAGLALGIGLLALTRQHVAIFSAEASLWSHNVQQYPEVWMGRLGLANALFEQGKPDAALPQYLRVLELNPVHAGARANLGALYAQRDDPAAAERHLRAAVQLDPRNPNTRFNLGRVCLAGGQLREGIEQLEAALQYRPADWGIQYHLGAAHLKAATGQGRPPTRARDLARQACADTGRRNLHALELLARAEAACGQPAAGAAVAREAAELAAAHQMAEEAARLAALAVELGGATTP
jgi:tetratricopeptide (TPR) repeat protein